MARIEAKIVEISVKELQHSHIYAQIVIPLVSYHFIQTDKADYLIDPSALVYLPPNLPHKYRSEPGNQALLINIPEQLLKSTDMDKLDSSIRISIDESILLIIQLICLEIESQTDSNSINYLYFYLYDKLVATRTSASLEYLSTHYEEPISISELAEIEHYNVNYYREWFKKQTGMRPKAYIQKLRVEKAKELLLTTEYSISEIASQVGYDHSSSFLRAFKTMEHCTPNAYRNSKH